MALEQLIPLILLNGLASNIDNQEQQHKINSISHSFNTIINNNIIASEASLFLNEKLMPTPQTLSIPSSSCSSGFFDELFEDENNLKTSTKYSTEKIEDDDDEEILIDNEKEIMLRTCKIAIFGSSNVGKTHMVKNLIFFVDFFE